MKSNLTSSNNSIENNLKGYKICAGKGCNNPGIHHLSIIYINKDGLFCETCKNELEKCGLVLLNKSIKNDYLEVTKSD
jgi:hypothetical protein